ncbi:MAG: molybdenum cofactor biosynthesis protein MoaE [Gammaproteobacteria bacterium]|nr:molybdenum cofactor biosynthesis protein MoaE [Gammaproteobacteria bacterium]
MTVRVTTEPFDPYAELAAYTPRGEAAGIGAAALFIGYMRDVNEGDAVASMELEHYPGMTERALEKLREEAVSRWRLDDALIVHRVGALSPTDPIVLVAAWSAHRNAALEACRFLIEELKHRAPFWKKERLGDRERWVERNTPG